MWSWDGTTALHHGIAGLPPASYNPDVDPGGWRLGCSRLQNRDSEATLRIPGGIGMGPNEETSCLAVAYQELLGPIDVCMQTDSYACLGVRALVDVKISRYNR